MRTIHDLVGLAGIALIGYGVAQIHLPSAYIVVGAIFLVIGLLAARVRTRQRGNK